MPILTDAMRVYLDASSTDRLLRDYILGFIHQFKLTPAEAGVLMGQRLKEVWAWK